MALVRILRAAPVQRLTKQLQLHQHCCKRIHSLPKHWIRGPGAAVGCTATCKSANHEQRRWLLSRSKISSLKDTDEDHSNQHEIDTEESSHGQADLEVAGDRAGELGEGSSEDVWWRREPQDSGWVVEDSEVLSGEEAFGENVASSTTDTTDSIDMKNSVVLEEEDLEEHPELAYHYDPEKFDEDYAKIYPGDPDSFEEVEMEERGLVIAEGLDGADFLHDDGTVDVDRIYSDFRNVATPPPPKLPDSLPPMTGGLLRRIQLSHLRELSKKKEETFELYARQFSQPLTRPVAPDTADKARRQKILDCLASTMMQRPYWSNTQKNTMLTEGQRFFAMVDQAEARNKQYDAALKEAQMANRKKKPKNTTKKDVK